jgi:hypothetical protein
VPGDWGRRQVGVSVLLVTRRVTGRVACLGNDLSGWDGCAGLAPAAGLIRSLSASSADGARARAIDGAGSYGAGLARYLSARGETRSRSAAHRIASGG